MAPLTDLEKTLIIGFCVVGGSILLFLFCFIVICTCRNRCGRDRKQDTDSNDTESSPPHVGSKPPPLPQVPASLKTTTAAAPASPSTTSDNISCISSSPTSPRFPQQQQQQQRQHPAELATPGQSLIFPSAHSKYAAMRVGRSAWTAAYLPPQATTPYAQRYGALERGAADLDSRYGSEQYRTRSSRGFEPIHEEVSASDPFVARVQSNIDWRGNTPPSDRGSQTKLLGAAIDPAMNYDDAASYQGGVEGGHAGRMLPRSRPGYAPYSPSAIEAARRRTQELYNARRAQSQLGSQMGSQIGSPIGSQLGSSPHRSSAGSALPPSPPRSAGGREMIWSRTSGRPHTGSYVIGAHGGVDDADPAFYRPTALAGPASLPGGATPMYLQAEEARPSSTDSQTIVIEDSQQSAPSDTPRERHLIGDAFRFLDEFDE